MREKLPRIEALRVLNDMRLSLRFSDGWKTIVALEVFVSKFESLAPLARPTIFARAKIQEWGTGVTWDDEGPLSIASTTLYRLAAEQSDSDARRFDAWMITNGLSATRAAQSLGMTRRSIINYRTGSRPIPRYVMLACKGWEIEQALFHQ
jgi:hypothetical protein